MQEVYYAKSEISNAYGRRPYVSEHLKDVADAAVEFASVLGLRESASLAGMFHDFGKYSAAFQKALNYPKGTPVGLDHAVCGAVLLWLRCKDKRDEIHSGALKAVIEAVNGHHDGLRNYDEISCYLKNIARGRESCVNGGKTPAITGEDAYKEVFRACFKRDFSPFPRPNLPPFPEEFDHREHPDTVGSMLYTRMLFSCLVDADYSVSASDRNPRYLEQTTDDRFDPAFFLEKLHSYLRTIQQDSCADSGINRIRDSLFAHCGYEGEHSPEGLFTLSAPTGTGKTLALLHFALRHCSAQHAALFPGEPRKRRVILVLPFLTLADQCEDTYRKILLSEDGTDCVLIDHSQSSLPDEGRELASRWSVPVIITTTVKFFESLFACRPTDCRKLHSIADSVILFDEAQSLPPKVTPCTLQAVNELCGRWHCTMVFSTATQPDFDQIPNLNWKPREILPPEGGLSPGALFSALRRVQYDWRLDRAMSFVTAAAEMSEQSRACAIVNLRRHARMLYGALREICPKEEIFYLTTDLCPAHRRKIVEIIRERLRNGKPCRVVATQCIEAGVDLDFDVIYRALAPLESIIQAAGRCNRHGRLEGGGRVIVFRPEEEGYPDEWYGNAAEIVENLLSKYPSGSSQFDPDNPDHVQEYYQRLFPNARDHDKLRKALEDRDFAETDRQYQLIPDQGRRVIVPYQDDRETYESIREEAQRRGLTNSLIRQAAPITVTTFEKNLADFAEQLSFSGQRSEQESGCFILRPQHRKLYTADMGLQLEGTAEVNPFC